MVGRLVSSPVNTELSCPVRLLDGGAGDLAGMRKVVKRNNIEPKKKRKK